MLVCSYLVLNSLIIANTTFMVLALVKFIQIVSYINEKRDLNRFLIGLQTFALVVWFGAFLGLNLNSILHWNDNYEYNNVVRNVTLDQVGFYSSLVILIIIAQAIFKSSKVASTQDFGQARQTKSLLQYLRNQYAQKGRPNIFKDTRQVNSSGGDKETSDTRTVSSQSGVSITSFDAENRIGFDSNGEESKVKSPYVHIDKQQNNNASQQVNDDPWACFEFNNDFKGKDFLTRDDWHLCEGLLSVFMNTDNQQTIRWDKEKRDNTQPHSQQSEKVVLLDFGSYKETISIDASSFPGSI